VKNPSGAQQTFSITGSQEADPVNGKISNESPMGKAFISHKAGEVVEVKSPRGVMEFKIVSID
ncbi:MAG: GreA/GreB family elongation factor, partial [Candidatus Kerfeldbacteria bacterium]|nr:GreA/GreB family elongation factor [Candidatus Kerfeldbacteria bacterium]